jgi:hypothetical protein
LTKENNSMGDEKIGSLLALVGTAGAFTLQEVNPLLSFVCAVMTIAYLALSIKGKLK